MLEKATAWHGGSPTEKTKLEINILSMKKDRDDVDYYAKKKDRNIVERRAIKKNIEERYGSQDEAAHVIKAAMEMKEAEKQRGGNSV